MALNDPPARSGRRRAIRSTRSRTLFAILILVLVGCTPAGTPGASPAASTPATPSRITAVISGAPPVLYNKLADPAIAGVGAVEALVNVGMSIQDHTGTTRPRLAESLPAV